MKKHRLVSASVVLALVLGAASSAHADEFAVDPAHSSVVFKISHLGLAWVNGRFDDISGSFALDSDRSRTSFSLVAKAESIDTNNAKRDEHLKSPDFFGAKQFPEITFQSTGASPIEGGYRVTGELTIKGVAKLVTFDLMGGRTAEFPPGVHRTGFTAELPIKRSDFGVGAANPALGDDVFISLSFEGTKK